MKTITALLALCISLFCIPGIAQANPENTWQIASSVAPDFTTAPIPSASASTQPVAPITTPPITWPEIADKSVSKAMDVLKDNSEKVWGVLIWQQYVKAVAYPSVTLLCMLIVLGLWKSRVFKNLVPDLQMLANIIFSFFMVILGLTLLFTVADAACIMLNPEFYAAKDLFEVIRGDN